MLSSFFSQVRPALSLRTNATSTYNNSPRGFRVEPPARAEVEIHVAVPTIESLVEQARRWTQSCILIEQLDVCARFFQKVALRGQMHGKYSTVEVEKLGALIEYMVTTRAAEIARSA